MTPSFCAEVTDQVRPVPGSVSSMSTSVAAPVPLLVTVIVNTAGWPALIVPLVVGRQIGRLLDVAAPGR